MPIEAPERPIPVIAAPVYFPGIIPVIPNTLAYKMAIITPISITTIISRAYAVSCYINAEKIGSIHIKTMHMIKENIIRSERENL